MKIVTVVGARPQFIKAAVVSKKIRQRHEEILVHTGQHYDTNMSDVFFEELEIPKPDYNLGINGGSHAEMTAKMLIEIEKILLEEKPDMLLVYGDTNSTLAAALAAAKIHIPICHVEAGARTYSLTNPEEINRICTDHISSLLLTCTEKCQNNLVKEGLEGRGKFVGDPMYEAFCFYKRKAEYMKHHLITLEGKEIEMPVKYCYLTCHREENTVRESALEEIMGALEQLDYPSIYPVHPRNRKRAEGIIRRYQYKNIYLIEPVGYLTSIYLVMNAEKVVTDSGGLQREAFFAGKQCVTILDFEVWPETMVDNRNQLSAPKSKEILTKLSSRQKVNVDYRPFGNGIAADMIVRELEQYIIKQTNLKNY